MAQPINNIPPMVFHGTNKHEGWREIFSPQTGAMAYLTYARMVCGRKITSHTLENDEREWAFFCVAGPATITINGTPFELARHDLLYAPRRAKIVITGKPGTDLAVAGAPAERDAPARLIRIEDIKKDPTKVIEVGSGDLHTKRTIYSMLDNTVPCSRLLAGFTVGTPGAWTSWPPHEHNDSKEEFYLFFDMPAPAFSVQFVYPSSEKMEFCPVVRDGSCVSIPNGYHPTAAAPGYATVFMWAMAAYDPDQHRDLKCGITLQPDYSNIKFL